MMSSGEAGAVLLDSHPRGRRKKTSLDDIDASTSTPFHISSPRSLTALRNCSLRSERLHYKPLDDFKDDDVSVRVAKTNYEVFEKRRLQKLELVKKEFRSVCR